MVFMESKVCLITGNYWALLLIFRGLILQNTPILILPVRKEGGSIVWLAANPAATLVFCFWDHWVCSPAADALGVAGLGWSNPAC